MDRDEVQRRQREWERQWANAPWPQRELRLEVDAVAPRDLAVAVSAIEAVYGRLVLPLLDFAPHAPPMRRRDGPYGPPGHLYCSVTSFASGSAVPDVKHDSPEAWAEALQDLIGRRSRLVMVQAEFLDEWGLPFGAGPAVSMEAEIRERPARTMNGCGCQCERATGASRPERCQVSPSSGSRR